MEGLCAFFGERVGILRVGFGEATAWLPLGVVLIVFLFLAFLALKRWRRRRRRGQGTSEAQGSLRSDGGTTLEISVQGSLGRGPVFEGAGSQDVGSSLESPGEGESVSVEAEGSDVRSGGSLMAPEEAGESFLGEPGPATAFVDRLRARLNRTQEQFVGRLDRLLLRRRTINPEMLEELEEVLVEADLGLRTTASLLGDLEKALSRGMIEAGDLTAFLKERILAALSVPSEPLQVDRDKPFVMMVVGVNGVGKTTTIGKLAGQFVRQGRKVMLVAADTFRAAAIEQLEIWSQRTGSDFIRHKAGADPGGVVFDAMRAAEARGTDVVMIDTAGRLHTKTNLMEELKKIRRVLQKQLPQAPHEILLVVDATTGQNAIQQARVFHEALGVTGLVLTKLDGSAKGGVVVGIAHELQIPVRYIGIGEKEEDLSAFDPRVFVEALFHRHSEGYLH